MRRLVGVLAVQGAFAEHERMLGYLGAQCIELRQRDDLARNLDAVVLPGGESTAQTKLLADLDMLAPLRRMVEEGLPTLGTCAGLILLAHGGALGTLDVTVRRNAYGRQLASSRARGRWMDGREVPVTLIRAPRITRIGSLAEPLVTLGDATLGVRQGNQIGLTYHPELDDCTMAHELLLACT